VVDETAPRFRGERVGDPGRAAGRGDVVGVEHEHDAARRGLDAGVESRRMTAILLEHRDDTIAVSRDDLARAIGRAVVDDDDLDVGVRLGERAVDRLRQERRVVVAREDDRRPHASSAVRGGRHVGRYYPGRAEEQTADPPGRFG
jgi:hypothetical protein